MLNLSKKPASHEELFLNRYPELISWSLQLSGYDRNKAEDLVHDAYIQWTLVRPDLQSIRNLDGYLYGMLRNMHAAELRRAFRTPSTSLSVIEYDSAFLGLQRASDEMHTARMQDQLRTVCEYACARKETSKAGSLLLLRFFHGYYPGEAARIAGIRRVTVDSWLRIARTEAKLYLENPEALKFMREDAKRQPAFSANGNEYEFLDEITQRISHSCCGRCLSDKKLRGFYSQPEAQALDCESLAHLSSCQRCLAKAAKILSLPPKDDRYPPDCLGRDPQPGEKSLGARNAPRKQRGPHRLRLQMEEVIEHRPKELHVAVNGFTVGTQKVISERIEHSLKLSLLEQIGLVEVLSEQGIRLLCLYVEAPPAGAIEQSACVRLSDERKLEISLNFRDQWPNLELTYSDPHFAEVGADPETIAEHEVRDELRDEVLRPDAASRLGDTASAFPKLISLLRAAGSRHFWLRPAAVTAVVVLLLAVALLLLHRASPPPVAAEVLARARTTEETTLVGPGEISHRNITFEERQGSGPITRRRIEVWSHGVSGNRARRLYDETGALVAGAWQSGADTPQNVFYNHGSKLKVLPPSQPNEHSVSADHLWLLDPSAVTFSALVRGMDSADLQTQDKRYVLNYRQRLSAQVQGSTRESMPKLIAATLVLDRASLRAISQTLIFGQGGEEREFTFTELSFEKLPVTSVDQKIFQPDAELLSPVEQPAAENRAAVSTAKPLPVSIIHPPTAAELGALEVNILYLLDQINANSGEQVEVRRLPERGLLVEALVETDKRKTEILRALASEAGNPLVRMDVVTLEEALRRQSDTKRSPESLDRVIITTDRIPVYDELRRYLERQTNERLRSGGNNQATPSGDIDSEIRRFSGRMIDQSRQALLHAFALKYLVERFSANDLGSLNEESRRKWHEMIRRHARAFRESTSGLRHDLTPIFPHTDAGQGGESTAEIRDDAAVIEAVKSLINFASANDEAISRAFALSPDMKPAINTPGSAIFWRTLNRAESLAAALERIP